MEGKKYLVVEDLVTKFNYECSCGCGEMQFTQWKDDGVSFISYNIPAFHAYQRGLWDTIQRRSKIIWNVLLGKEYRFYEIVIDNNKTLQEFKRFVSSMAEVNEYKAKG
jgi:hypothetical protein